MKISWNGSRVTSRVVGSFEWSDRTGFVQDVDTDLALELLTAPDGQFKVAEDEPLLRLPGMDEQWLVTLATHGITNMASLAELSSAQVKALALKVWGSSRQIGEWVRLAEVATAESRALQAQGVDPAEMAAEAQRVRIEKLKAAGITSVEALAALNEDELVSTLAPIWGEGQIEAWRNRAQKWQMDAAIAKPTRVAAKVAARAVEAEAEANGPSTSSGANEVEVKEKPRRRKRGKLLEESV